MRNSFYPTCLFSVQYDASPACLFSVQYDASPACLFSVQYDASPACLFSVQYDASPACLLQVPSDLKTQNFQKNADFSQITPNMYKYVYTPVESHWNTDWNWVSTQFPAVTVSCCIVWLLLDKGVVQERCLCFVFSHYSQHSLKPFVSLILVYNTSSQPLFFCCCCCWVLYELETAVTLPACSSWAPCELQVAVSPSWLRFHVMLR